MLRTFLSFRLFRMPLLPEYVCIECCFYISILKCWHQFELLCAISFCLCLLVAYSRKIMVGVSTTECGRMVAGLI